MFDFCLIFFTLLLSPLGRGCSTVSLCFRIQKLSLPVYSFYTKFFAFLSHHYFILYSLMPFYFRDPLYFISPLSRRLFAACFLIPGSFRSYRNLIAMNREWAGLDAWLVELITIDKAPSQSRPRALTSRSGVNVDDF